MKDIFDRHEDRLTEAEDRRLWASTFDAVRRRPPRWGRWGISAAVTTGLAAVVVVALVGRAPERTKLMAGSGPARVENDARLQAQVPVAAQAPEQVQEHAQAQAQAQKEMAGARVADRATPGESAPPASAAPVALKAAAAAPGTIHGRVLSAAGEPLVFANIVIVGTDRGTLADSAGIFAITGLAAGQYTIQITYLGYESVEKVVAVGVGASADLALNVSLTEVQMAELGMGEPETFVEEKAKPESDRGLGELIKLPVQRLKEAVGLKAGNVSGGARDRARSEGAGAASSPSASVQTLGVAPAPRTPDDSRWPVSVGGTDPVNGQAFDSMFFKHYGVNPFVDPQDDRFATFAVDVDNASYTLARSYLERGELPPDEAVRVEEFVNAMHHGYRAPRGPELASRGGAVPSRYGTFAIYLDAAPSPFGPGLVLLRVGLKGREIDARNRKPAVLTFVVDVSGSMAREDRLELVKKTLHLLLDQMRADDEVGLVVYGSDARVVLPHTALRHRDTIEEAIDSLRPEGSTNAEAGLRQGYALADRGWREGWINRIILCSDGVANVGETGAEGILQIIQREAHRGIYLTAAGFGMGNYNDVLMEQLANHADGNYYYVDDLPEARRVFVENLTGTLQTIARQVKIQVEFDADTVRRYRLLGYENRDVADRDFRNDAVDAGEVGAGHEVTALFEAKLEKDARRGDLATVRIRYEDPETGVVTEEARSLHLSDVASRIEDAEPTFQLDAATAEFAEILRHSYWAKDGDLAPVVGLARSASRRLGHAEDAEEMARLAETAWKLWPRGEEPRWRDDSVKPRWEPQDDGGQ